MGREIPSDYQFLAKQLGGACVCCIIKMDKVANKNTHFCKGNIPRIAKAIESKIKPRYPIR